MKIKLVNKLLLISIILLFKYNFYIKLNKIKILFIKKKPINKEEIQEDNNSSAFERN